MHRLRRLSPSAWILVGLAVGAIAVPAVALAAGAQLVTIRGNNQNASVTPAGQLRVAEMDPRLTAHLRTSASSVGGSTCRDLGTPSTSRAFVLKQANINAGETGGFTTHEVDIFASANCGGSVVASADLTAGSSSNAPLGPGVALPSGTHLSAFFFDVGASVDLYGYTVQDGAVPHTATAMHRLGPVGTAKPKR
jgi:hypothetical protein